MAPRTPVNHPRQRQSHCSPWCFLIRVLLVMLVSGTAIATVPVTPQDFGAVADGETDDTAAIQAAVDHAVAGTGRVLHFPPGTYRVKSVDIQAGLTLMGYGATIKKMPAEPKFSRTFTTENRKHLGAHDSEPLIIKGFTFDGSRTEQGTYEDYCLEQQHMIFLQGDPAGPGRLTAVIEDCTFRDGVADAISVYTNVAASISNGRATDVFRGGVVVTGGHSEVHLSNFTAQGAVHPTGIDVEVDGAGYNGSFETHITATNLRLDGDFDVGIHDGSTFHGSNIHSMAGPFNLYARDATIRIMNSTFGVGPFSDSSNRIVHPHDVSFSHCTFIAHPSGSTTPVERIATAHVYWNISGTDERDQRLRFIDCDFLLHDTLTPESTRYAIYVEADQQSRNNQLLLQGGRIAPGYNYGVYVNQGGNATLRDVVLDAHTGAHLGATADYPLHIVLDGARYGENTTTTTHINAAIPASRIEHQNIHLPARQNRIGTTYGLVGNTYVGSRTLTGQTPPHDTPGLQGDTYQLESARPGQPYRWICVESHPNAATWAPVEQLRSAK